METYIAMLLFIVPGFISMFVYNRISNPERKKSDFMKTVSALIFNIFIFGETLLILQPFYPEINILGLTNNFKYANFAVFYILTTLVCGIVTAVLWDILSSNVVPLVVNKYRVETMNRNKILEKPSAFENIFNDGKNHLVCITKADREIGFGMLKKMNFGADQNFELSLCDIGDWADYKAGMDKHCEIKEIYYDADRDLKIIDYEFEQYL